MLDNALALKIFLPRAVRPSTLGTMDPIAGPLVAAARRLGLLPEAEGDGWRGEPSSWADADSLTQRLSAFSQRRLGSLKQWLAERAAGEYDVAAVDARLEAAIAGSPVMLFSFASCPFCKKAKALLTAKGAAFSVLELDEDADGAARVLLVFSHPRRPHRPCCGRASRRRAVSDWRRTFAPCSAPAPCPG